MRHNPRHADGAKNDDTMKEAQLCIESQTAVIDVEIDSIETVENIKKSMPTDKGDTDIAKVQEKPSFDKAEIEDHPSISHASRDMKRKASVIQCNDNETVNSENLDGKPGLPLTTDEPEKRTEFNYYKDFTELVEMIEETLRDYIDIYIYVKEDIIYAKKLSALYQKVKKNHRNEYE